MPRTVGSQNQQNLKYQKLYNWGRTLITSGVIKNQDKFPSEHILQKKFGYILKGIFKPECGRAHH